MNPDSCLLCDGGFLKLKCRIEMSSREWAALFFWIQFKKNSFNFEVFLNTIRMFSNWILQWEACTGWNARLISLMQEILKGEKQSRLLKHCDRHPCSHKSIICHSENIRFFSSLRLIHHFPFTAKSKFEKLWGWCASFSVSF